MQTPPAVPLDPVNLIAAYIVIVGMSFIGSLLALGRREPGARMPAWAARPLRLAAFSNNYVYKSGGTPTWSDAYSTLSAFNTAFGAKSAGNSQADPVITTPTLGNSWNTAPTVGSPLIDAGHATLSSRTDVDRYIPAGVRRDIGAREYNRTTQAPLGPTGARIQ